MNRRIFLTRLIGGAAALAVLPAIEQTAAAFPAALDTYTGPAWLSTYRAALYEAGRLFLDQRRTLGLPVDPAHCYIGYSKLGERLPSGEYLTRQQSIGAEWFEQPGERILQPAMVTLAGNTVEAGLDRFGVAPVGMPGCDFTGTYGPLRMVVMYSINQDALVTRFDVIGAASADGRRFVELRRRDRLKQQIRHRLTQPRRPLPLPA